MKLFISFIFLISSWSWAQNLDEDPLNFEHSLMVVRCAYVDYDHYRPWKIGRMLSRTVQACAISEDTILTLASGIKNAKFIQVTLPFQRQVVSGKVSFIDYNSNICLIKLDSKALTEKLVPLNFKSGFEKRKDVQFNWFSTSQKSFEAFGKLEDYKMHRFDFARGSFLTYSISNISSAVDPGTIVFDGKDAIGVTYQSSSSSARAHILAGEVIEQILERYRSGNELSFPMLGFSYTNTAETPLRQYLGLDQKTGGIYIEKVASLGTGSKQLQAGDVILNFAGRSLDAWGRVDLPEYEQIGFELILAQFKVGESIPLVVMRNKKKLNFDIKAEKFSESETFVPMHHFDSQPRYHVVGGFVFQTLSSEYLREWGTSWKSRSPVDLYRYFEGESLNFNSDRKEVVILNHVLPHASNQGYQDLRFKIVQSFNGKTVNSLDDLIKAKALQFHKKFHVIELEKSNPTVVISREGLKERDRKIAKRYGLPPQ